VFNCKSPTYDFDFTDYIIFNNYVSPDEVFPTILWAGKPSEEPKTTNGPESFYRHYNSQFYTSHLTIHETFNLKPIKKLKVCIKENQINKKTNCNLYCKLGQN